jgi:catechol 2,3-dioxygenase
MGVGADDIFGGDVAQPAIPGTYGRAPSGFRLPAATHLGAVRLQVASLDRSLAYYGTVLGMRVLEREGTRATLGAHDDARVLVELNESAGTRPARRAGRLGLYHFAILLPDRASLGRFARHLNANGVAVGAADHLVSEAFYLTDPDGLGIEVYADRPRETWRRVGRELMLATDPIDFPGLLRAAGDAEWTGMPARTVMGHVHLHVGSIEQADAFFADVIGFDRTTWSYPGALFLGAGGYHHHLGTNTWAGANATPSFDDEARLLEWTIVLSDASSLRVAADNIARAGRMPDADGDDIMTRDPWGTAIRLRAGTADE